MYAHSLAPRRQQRLPELQQPRRRLLRCSPVGRGATNLAAAMLTRLLPTTAVDAAHAAVDAAVDAAHATVDAAHAGRYGLQSASMAASVCFALGRALLD